MDLQHSLNRLMGLADNLTKIDIARQLEPYTGEERVMDVLCTAAVYTEDGPLRKVLLDVLNTNATGAFARFSDYALWSKDPVARKHALINLSLMGCREANDAVISGLYDPDAAVRRAAVMSAGLYDDKSVHMALAHFFENHRLELTHAFAMEGADVTQKPAGNT